MQDKIEQEIRQLVALEDEQLYAMLIPSGDTLYSPEGRRLHAKRVFEQLIIKCRVTICKTYHRVREDVPDVVHMTVLLVLALQENGHGGHTPLAPFAALVVRRGLDQLCLEEHHV
jgi:hypothetical protein